MKHRPLFWLAVCAILLLASLLRFVNLETNPGWYTDEATHLEVVRHLLNGRIQYFAINQSTLLFSRLPLFELLLATAVQGINTPHLPAELPSNRYAFNPHIQEAQIVVIDNLWHNWAQIHVPGVAEKMADLQTKIPIFQSGDITVYRRSN